MDKEEKEIKEKEEIILGLDISTKTIGVCLLLDDGSETGKIITLTHVSPKIPKNTDAIESLFIKTEIFRNEFLKKYKDIGITKVVIEEPLVRSNNANTVSTLLRFNGMISLAVYEELGVKATYISSYDARKYSFPDFLEIRKFGKNGEAYPHNKVLKAVKDGNVVLFGGYPWDIDKKTLLQGKVSELFPDIEWICDKKGELKKENFDASDAYVATLGFMHKAKYGELVTSVENVVDEENKIHYTLCYWDRKEERTIHLK